MRSLALLVAPALLAATPAAAGEGCGGDTAAVRQIFDSADTDRSGALSPAEYGNARLESFGVSFDETDANADGETSFREYLDLYLRTHPPADQSEA